MSCSNYLRVGTKYYKYVMRPNINGSKDKVLILWKKETIIQDHGKEILNDILKYDGFISIPSHTNYQASVGTFKNNYFELQGNITKGEFPNIDDFITHIFGEQKELGYDYLTIMFQIPNQVLPVLCLVSEQKHTGKTTFFKFIKMLFQYNATFVQADSLRSNFNSDWVDKLVIMADEVKFDRQQDSDRIKELSTATSFKIESKGVDRYEIPFFGKIMLGSNHINDFILIDNNEIRYWVLDVKKPSKYIDDFENKLMRELPYFKYFLANRKITTECKSRMWFTRDQIQTKALQRVIKGSRISVENDLKIILLNLFEVYEKSSLKFTLSELVTIIKQDHIRATMSQIKNIVEEKWLLEKSQSTTYKFYAVRYCDMTKKSIVDEIPKKGRVYMFHKEYISKL